MTAVTMTYVDEAIGVVRATGSVGLPVVILLTVETDGVLPSGEPLGDAIARVDDATDGAPAYYMVNCAHPADFAEQLTAGAPVGSHGSRRSVPTPLAAATQSSTKRPSSIVATWPILPAGTGRLNAIPPDLRVVGGRRGTDHEHVAAIAESLAGVRS